MQKVNASAGAARAAIAVEARTNPGMGRKALDAVYFKLGQTEIDDMADGVKALWSRPYTDKNRVGIFGTSYGGYTSLMEFFIQNLVINPPKA